MTDDQLKEYVRTVGDLFSICEVLILRDRKYTVELTTTSGKSFWFNKDSNGEFEYILSPDQPRVKIKNELLNAYILREFERFVNTEKEKVEGYQRLLNQFKKSQ